MKKLTLLIAMLMAIGGCSNEVPFDQLVERGGLKYEVNSQTPFTGSAVEYYDNGQFRFKENYKDGKLDGLWKSYYENGQLKEKVNFIDGKEDGLYVYYRKNGTLITKKNYKDGKLDGLRETYHEDGHLWSKDTYKDGKEIPLNSE